MGRIELATPVSHIWFLKGRPSPISLFLERSVEDLESVVNYEKYLVVDPGRTSLAANQVLDEKEFSEQCEACGTGAFVAGMGARAIREALSRVDLQARITALDQELNRTGNKQKQKQLAERLRLFRAFLENGTRPEWMVLTVLPVLPPGLRPLIPLKSGKLADPDVDELYRRVIKRNERLKELIECNCPDEQMVRAQERVLQKAVDQLFENGKMGLKATINDGDRFRMLKPLADLLRGKKGLFRQNLLGKRVDYSGRSVIVVGPELKLHQCGLPKKIAVVLFEPFIIQRWRELNRNKTIRDAKEWIKKQPVEIWDILEEVMRQRLVLLNRQPTLHRLSIQAFEPILVEGDAIHIHPLVCTAYNADFDGDQMAVHVPLSDKALSEARRLMLSTNDIFLPSSGRPIVTPTQDIALGCYYLTVEPRDPPPQDFRTLPLFGSKQEVVYVHDDSHEAKVHQRIRLSNPDFGKQTVFGNAWEKIIVTTVGRVLFNDILPPALGFLNKTLKKSDLGDLISNCHQVAGHQETVAFLDRLKELGFREATRSGLSIGIDDILIPSEKEPVIEKAAAKVREFEEYHSKGLITANERQERSQDIWRQCSNLLAKAVERNLQNNPGKVVLNPLWLMLGSGARGNLQQLVQLAGWLGLRVKANGDVTTKPILSNFREGLVPLDFFLSSYGARKGTCDTALKTASAGYLTRKLMAAAEEVVVVTGDCRTDLGRSCMLGRQNGESEGDFVRRIVFLIAGRVAADDIFDLHDTQKLLVGAGKEISESVAETLASSSVARVKIRSVLTCQCRRGVCAACYGRDLATGIQVRVGEAVGVIAAQSIGEPGTQLTMRTFHTGGVATDKGDITGGLPRVDEILEARRPRPCALFSGIAGTVSFERNRNLIIISDETGRREGHRIVPGIRVFVHDGNSAVPGQRLTEGAIDPLAFVRAFGPLALQERLVDEVQEIYQLQGASIHQKHLEIIFRQMFSKVRITQPGGTRFLVGEQVDRSDFLDQNDLAEGKGGLPAQALPVLLGIKRVALQTKSFLGAASFEHTTRILANAAVLSKKDDCLGLKQQVMTGGLIPAGTGFEKYKRVRLSFPGLAGGTENETAPVVAPPASAG